LKIDDRDMTKPSRTEVIGIASGKGGVGKTTVAVNLAIALRLMGHRVMLFDADLGLANAQIALGCTCPYNLSHFLSGQKNPARYYGHFAAWGAAGPRGLWHTGNGGAVQGTGV